MKVLISGSKQFDDHLVFRRAMSVVMSDLSDKELTLLLSGSFKTNEIARQFVNLTEEPLRLRGVSIKYTHVPPRDVPWDDVDKVVAFVVPPQRNTPLGYKAQERDIDVDVFRF